MAIILALEDLYARMQTEFTLKLPQVVFNFGTRSVLRQPTTSFFIIDVAPGDESGNIGPLIMPMEVGGSPRHLYDVMEKFTVYCRGFDSSQPEDQQKQYKATMLLAQAAIASMRNAVPGLVKFDSWKWNRQVGSERMFGSQIIINCILRSPIPDLEFNFGIPEIVEADVNETLLDEAGTGGTTKSFHVIGGNDTL